MQRNLKCKAKDRHRDPGKPRVAHLAHELFLLGNVFREVITDVQHQHWHMLQSFEVEPGAEGRDARVTSLSYHTNHSEPEDSAHRQYF